MPAALPLTWEVHAALPHPKFERVPRGAISLQILHTLNFSTVQGYVQLGLGTPVQTLLSVLAEEDSGATHPRSWFDCPHLAPRNNRRATPR